MHPGDNRGNPYNYSFNFNRLAIAIYFVLNNILSSPSENQKDAKAERGQLSVTLSLYRTISHWIPWSEA